MSPSDTQARVALAVALAVLGSAAAAVGVLLSAGAHPSDDLRQLTRAKHFGQTECMSFSCSVKSE